MFRVTRGKVKYGGIIYGKNEKAGDVISGLSAKQKKSLVNKGYGERIGNESTKEKANIIIPDDYTVDDVKDLIEKTNDIEVLYSLLDYEEANKNRSGVTKPLEEKIVELEETETGEPVDINVNINPDEVVQD